MRSLPRNPSPLLDTGPSRRRTPSSAPVTSRSTGHVFGPRLMLLASLCIYRHEPFQRSTLYHISGEGGRRRRRRRRRRTTTTTRRKRRRRGGRIQKASQRTPKVLQIERRPAGPRAPAAGLRATRCIRLLDNISGTVIIFHNFPKCEPPYLPFETINNIRLQEQTWGPEQAS